MAAERYKFAQHLGKGGQANVALVYDTIRGQHVAFKRLSKFSADNSMLLKKEFRVMKELFHPNLARLYELGEDNEGYFFTMEYVKGFHLKNDNHQHSPARHPRQDCISAVETDVTSEDHVNIFELGNNTQDQEEITNGFSGVLGPPGNPTLVWPLSIRKCLSSSTHFLSRLLSSLLLLEEEKRP